MPFQLQRRPIGLDDLLGAKSWPRVQSEVADQLVVTFDARREYLAARKYGALSAVASTTGTAVNQSVACFTVPNGEQWWIENIGVFTAAATGAGWASTSITLTAFEVGVGDLSIYSGPAYRMWTIPVSHGTGVNIRAGVDTSGFWALPGSSLQVLFTGSGLTAQQVQMSWSGSRVII